MFVSDNPSFSVVVILLLLVRGLSGELLDVVFDTFWNKTIPFVVASFFFRTTLFPFTISEFFICRIVLTLFLGGDGN